MKTINFFIILILLASCQKRAEDCEFPPNCAPPNLNWQSFFLIEFCVSELDTTCYSISDLDEVRFIEKTKYSDEVVIDTILNELSLMNYTIQIGQGSRFKFGEDYNGGRVLSNVEYYYEIELESNSLGYKINKFKFRDDGPCSCPSYVIESVEINDVEVTVNQNKIILKK